LEPKDRIREARKKAGLTQKELATSTGIAEITIRNYEAGKCKPKYERYIKLAAAMVVDATWLMYGKTTMELMKAPGEERAMMQEFIQDYAADLVEARDLYLDGMDDEDKATIDTLVKSLKEKARWRDHRVKEESRRNETRPQRRG